jgi:hypothetical protein
MFCQALLTTDADIPFGYKLLNSCNCVFEVEDPEREDKVAGIHIN